MNLKTILAFAVIIAGLTLVIAPSVTVLQQQASASHEGSDPKADEKATKFYQKGGEKGLDEKDEQRDKAWQKAVDTCGGSGILNPGDTVHCTG